ncbi:MAG TPA: nucleotide exchange factor GrpE [Nitrososphaerales archaeon]|nr:nucleotide exchange factor GrpE [Nitrososphaerales archaeon]
MGETDQDNAQPDELDMLKEELEKEKERTEEYDEKYKRLLADYDNYRKQLDKEAEIRVRREVEKFLLKLLALRDDYVRAIEIVKKSNSTKTIINGLEGVLKNLDSILREEGIAEINALGTSFDPNFHEAVSFVDNVELPENTITTEIRKGYMLSNRVIRPTLVEVSKRPNVKNGG